jgi:probable rRNA maturation factor
MRALNSRTKIVVAPPIATVIHRDVMDVNRHRIVSSAGTASRTAARVTGQRTQLRVVVQKACRAPGIPAAARIREWLLAALDGVLSGEVTVRVIGEAESAQLNSTWRGKQGPTNVLSFPADGEIGAGVPGQEDCLPGGDIAVCAPVLEREAAEQDKALDAHWAHIVIHGGLHLAGYDHEAPEEAEAMEARERELLAGFGISDPYQVPHAPASGRRV